MILLQIYNNYLTSNQMSASWKLIGNLINSNRLRRSTIKNDSIDRSPFFNTSSLKREVLLPDMENPIGMLILKK